MATFDLYINIRPGAGRPAFVQSGANGSPFAFPKFFREGNVALRLYFQTPNQTGGVASPFTALTPSTYDCRVGIGTLGNVTPLCAAALGWNAGGYFEGTLNLNTSEMNTVLDESSSGEVAKVFEVELTGPGEEFTFQQPITVSNEVLISAGELPTDTLLGADTPLFGALRVDLPDGVNITDSASATAGGNGNFAYYVRLHVRGRVEMRNYTGGDGVPDPGAPTFYQNPTAPTGPVNWFKLATSSPEQTYYLNHLAGGDLLEGATNLDFYAWVKLNPGATLTLSADMVDGAQAYNPQWLSVVDAGHFAYTLADAPRTQGKETIWIPAGAMTPRTTDGPSSDTQETATHQVMVSALEFDPDTTQYAQFTVAMPKAWNLGTVSAEFLWTAASGTGAVRWAIHGLSLSDGNALDAAFGDAVFVTDAASAADTLRTTAETGAFTLGGTPAVKDMAVIQIGRHADDAEDTLTEVAKLIGVRLFYTINAANDD